MKNVCCMISLLADKQLTRSSGGIGRRVGLKIQSGAISVPVQVWPGAILKGPLCRSFFIGICLSAFCMRWLIDN